MRGRKEGGREEGKEEVTWYLLVGRRSKTVRTEGRGIMVVEPCVV